MRRVRRAALALPQISVDLARLQAYLVDTLGSRDTHIAQLTGEGRRRSLMTHHAPRLACGTRTHRRERSACSRMTRTRVRLIAAQVAQLREQLNEASEHIFSLEERNQLLSDELARILSHRTTADDLNKLLAKLQREQREQIVQYRTATLLRAKGAPPSPDTEDDVPVRERTSDSAASLVRPWGGEAFRAGEGLAPTPAWFTKLKGAV